MRKDLPQKETLPFLINYLPENMITKAEVELNESSENKAKGLQELKELARENTVTSNIEFEDDFLVQFLRKRKYDLQRAFRQLLTMTKLRKKSGWLFRRIELDTYFCHPSSRHVTILPKRCPDGCTIVLFELGKWIPAEFPLEELKTCVSTLFCQSMRDPMTQINGYRAIFDCINVPFSNFRYFTPQNIYQFYHGALECVPGRYKEMIMIVNSTALKWAWAIFRGFAPQKLKDRMFVKSSREELLDHFPASVLPVQYGGVLEDYFMAQWMEEANQEQADFGLGGQKNYY